MSIGSIVRTVLGPRGFRVVGRLYREVFVDLGEVARAVATAIPDGVHILDVGGGDGEPLNYLLDRLQASTVTMIDLSPAIGGFLEEKHRSRVEIRGGMSLRQYVDGIFVGGPHRRPDVLLVSDVMHHIPADGRAAFYHEIGRLFDRCPNLTVIIKDLEPGHWRTTLGRFCDRYITGDRNVRMISRGELVTGITQSLGALDSFETFLHQEDAPNYALVFRKHQLAGQ